MPSDFNEAWMESLNSKKHEPLTPISAIKTFCRICQGLGPKDQLDPVRECLSKWGKQMDSVDTHNFPVGCPLWPYRMGKNPRIKREMSEEQKNAVSLRMATYWKNKKGELE